MIIATIVIFFIFYLVYFIRTIVVANEGNSNGP